MRRCFPLVLVVLLFACDSEEDKAGRFLLKGNEALGKGEYNEAVRFFSEAIAKNDKFVEAYNNRGVANYKAGKFIEAISDYNKILLQINPDFNEARRNRVNAYLDAGRYEKALEDLEVLSDIFPDSAFVDFSRGLVYHEMKAFDKSIESFEMSFKKDDSNAETLVNVANGYYMVNDFENAKLTLQNAIGLDSQEPNSYNTLALIATEEKVYDEALSRVNEALALDAGNPFFLNNRGYIHLLMNNLEAAEPDIRRAIIGAPQNPWAYRNRGILFYLRDRFDDAVRNFEQAAKYDDKIPELNYYWAMTLNKLGKKEEACARIALLKDKDSDQAKALIKETCG
ncbi:tetratricopeptide repeat protein [Roseivirga sp.]|uniref:tetratricopeptide repeat protein n=1 Tax=Roseivirga sp. TaxID=1964215 RepID=UPI003B8CC2B0